MRIRRFPPIEDRTPEMATNRPKMGPKGPKLGQNGQNGHNGHNGPRRFAGFPLYCRFAPICRFPPLYWRFAPICWFSPVFTDLLVSSYIAGLRRFAGFPYIAGFRRFAGFPPYIGASRRFAGFPLYCRFSPISRLSRGSRGQFRQIRSRMRFFFGQFRIITGVGAVHTLPRHCMSYLSPEGGVLRHFWPIFGCFRPYFHLIRAGPSNC